MKTCLASGRVHSQWEAYIAPLRRPDRNRRLFFEENSGAQTDPRLESPVLLHSSRAGLDILSNLLRVHPVDRPQCVDGRCLA
jgi:hypothetical protein